MQRTQSSGISDDTAAVLSVQPGQAAWGKTTRPQHHDQQLCEIFTPCVVEFMPACSELMPACSCLALMLASCERAAAGTCLRHHSPRAVQPSALPETVRLPAAAVHHTECLQRCCRSPLQLLLLRCQSVFAAAPVQQLRRAAAPGCLRSELPAAVWLAVTCMCPRMHGSECTADTCSSKHANA